MMLSLGLLEVGVRQHHNSDQSTARLSLPDWRMLLHPALPTRNYSLWACWDLNQTSPTDWQGQGSNPRSRIFVSRVSRITINIKIELQTPGSLNSWRIRTSPARGRGSDLQTGQIPVSTNLQLNTWRSEKILATPSLDHSTRLILLIIDWKLVIRMRLATLSWCLTSNIWTWCRTKIHRGGDSLRLYWKVLPLRERITISFITSFINVYPLWGNKDSELELFKEHLISPDNKFHQINKSGSLLSF